MRDERDQVARYGGEEFLVFLPGADEQEAQIVAERMRGRVEAASLANPASRVVPYVTLSIGVAILMENDRAVSAEELQRRADAALYDAKRAGRNRVALYDPGLDEASA
jgi:diguanylate cyclase (GGDEF)-like protein